MSTAASASRPLSAPPAAPARLSLSQSLAPPLSATQSINGGLSAVAEPLTSRRASQLAAEDLQILPPGVGADLLQRSTTPPAGWVAGRGTASRSLTPPADFGSTLAERPSPSLQVGSLSSDHTHSLTRLPAVSTVSVPPAIHPDVAALLRGSVSAPPTQPVTHHVDDETRDRSRTEASTPESEVDGQGGAGDDETDTATQTKQAAEPAYSFNPDVRQPQPIRPPPASRPQLDNGAASLTAAAVEVGQQSQADTAAGGSKLQFEDVTDGAEADEGDKLEKYECKRKAAPSTHSHSGKGSKTSIDKAALSGKILLGLGFLVLTFGIVAATSTRVRNWLTGLRRVQ